MNASTDNPPAGGYARASQPVSPTPSRRPSNPPGRPPTSQLKPDPAGRPTPRRRRPGSPGGLTPRRRNRGGVAGGAPCQYRPGTFDCAPWRHGSDAPGGAPPHIRHGAWLLVVLLLIGIVPAGCERSSSQAGSDQSGPGGVRPAAATADQAAPAAGPAAGGSAPARRTDGGPRLNVVLISIDTTRADCLGCYGNARIRTPNIDRLAAEGTLFEQCVSPAPITLPSHTSMMTGTNPFVHGVRDNGQFFVHPDNVTLAERLRQAGYHTAAQVAAYVLNREFGLDQGFEQYGDVESARRLSQRAAARHAHERKADEVVSAALEWLAAAPGEPFFLFVHLFDPHRTYSPPPRFARLYADNPYLGEIAFADEQVGRLLAALDERGLSGRTLVVLTSDHGEGLGEHDEPTHASLVYDTTLLVPLIVRAPGHIAAGRRIAAQVRLIDLAPTVLDLLGLPIDARIEGRSLRGLLAGRDEPPAPWAYSETLHPRFTAGCAWLRALRGGGWKYIHGLEPELYHVAEDPHELHNLAAEMPDKVARMRSVLRDMLAAARPVTQSAARQLAPHELRALEALGYVGGDGEQQPDAAGELELFDPSGPDPREYIRESTAMAQAIEAMAAGDDARAEEILRGLLADARRKRTFWWAHKTLAEALRAQGKLDQALDEYRAALALRPDDGQTRSDYGVALAQAGRWTSAAEELHQALLSPPVFAETRYQYGRVLGCLGRQREAIDQFRAAVRQDPRFAAAWSELGQLLARLGRSERAEQALRKAVELEPDNTLLRGRLAEFLLSAGQPQAAIAEFEQIVASAPDDARAWGGLGASLAAVGKPAQAVAALRKATALDPRLKAAWLLLVQTLIEQRQYAEALACFDQAGATLDHDGRASALRALLLAAVPAEQMRDPPAATRLARSLLDQYPDHPLALTAWAAALTHAGDFDQAAAAARKAARKAARPWLRQIAAQVATAAQQRRAYTLPR